ncbi:MAG: ATP-binding protein [bacterium]|nr:ATP-binding protein [bacterium]
MTNPFFYGNPIPAELFVGRTRELRRTVNRIRNRGQSGAITGEPRSGKTSLLTYLAAPERRPSLFEDDADRLLFSYLDAQTIDGALTQARFWEYALHPLHQAAVAPHPGSDLAHAYTTCVENRFGALVLERLLAQMRLKDWRLVLMLDEMDELLHHPILNSAEFFGSLRSLASRSQGALALVIACRRPLAQLNKATQEFNRTGSPYFNFLDEITLGPLPATQVARLLAPANDRFTAKDRSFVSEVAGGHPFLLQVTASALWDAYDEEGSTAQERWKEAGQVAHDQASMTISDTWRLWSPATRKLFTGISLAHLSVMADGEELLEDRSFYVKRLIADPGDFGPERRSLQKQGFIAEDPRIPGGWRVLPIAYLWWMAEEVIRTVRSDEPFEDWLRAQEWGELLTRGEKERLSGIMRSVGGVLKTGVTALIESSAKSLGGSV